MDMTKFNSLDDPGFKAVVGEIRRWTRELGQVSVTPSSLPHSVSQPILNPSHPPVGQVMSSETSNPSEDTNLDWPFEHPNQITPMYLAVREGNQEMVKLLLNAGISANEPCYGTMPPLCVIGQTGDLEIAKLLIDSGADVNAWKEKPLFSAATKGHIELVKLLLANGANPDASKPDSWTALHTAMVTYHPEIADILINAGANVNATSITGATPLMIAIKRGYTVSHNAARKGRENGPRKPSRIHSIEDRTRRWASSYSEAFNRSWCKEIGTGEELLYSLCLNSLRRSKSCL